MSWLTDLLSHPTPNPSLVGTFKLTADEIDAEARERHEKKLHRARAYIRLKKLSIPAAYNAKGQQ